MTVKPKYSLALFCLTTATASTAQAASTVQTTMAVTTTNVNSCTVTALPLAFPAVSQLPGTNTDGQTSITVLCTLNTVYNVGLDNGTHASGSTRQMQLLGGTATIPYAIYSDASRAVPWGNTQGSDTVVRTAGLNSLLIPVYGRIPAGSSGVPGGSYSDTVTVTVSF